MPEYYKIKIKGHLDIAWSDWFAGLRLKHLEGNVTLLSGQLPDQAALHGLIERIRDFNVPHLCRDRGLDLFRCLPDWGKSANPLVGSSGTHLFPQLYALDFGAFHQSLARQARYGQLNRFHWR